MHGERTYRGRPTVEQHRVAERQEAVALGERVVVQRRASAAPTKASIIISSVVRGRWKLVSSRSTTCESTPRWRNSSVRPSSSPVAAAALQRPHGGGPDGHDPLGAAGTPLARRRRHAVALAVHAVVARVAARSPAGTCRARRPARRRTTAIPIAAMPADQLGREVQPGRRRGRRAGLGGVHRLVAVGIREPACGCTAGAASRRTASRSPSGRRPHERAPGTCRRPRCVPRLDDQRPSVGARQLLAAAQTCGPGGRAPPRSGDRPSIGSSSSTSAAPPVRSRADAGGPGSPCVSLTTTTSPVAEELREVAHAVMLRGLRRRGRRAAAPRPGARSGPGRCGPPAGRSRSPPAASTGQAREQLDHRVVCQRSRA